ncbi:MAG: glycosyltransferase family 2 protein [Deltaproteobacteria bacterium]|nr:glycosyltransferase family 2 protein [Deltaproteobacteria bacterium]
MVVIPALNEAEQIAHVVQQVKEEVPEALVLVVNDGSTDQTEQKALAAGAKVLSHPFNMGYGVALQTGYKYARQYGFDYVLQMDGDGQHDPRYLQGLLKEVQEGGVDVAIGSRFLGEGEYQVPLLRRVGMRLFGFIASRLSGQKITDPTSGYQALNQRAIEFCIRDAFPGDYPDADVLVMLHRAGLRFREVPVGMHPNLNGRSMHSGLKPLYYIYKMLLSIMLNLMRKK